MFRSFLVLAFVALLQQHIDAQIVPKDYSSGDRPAWNGRDAVIHRPGDKPYALYHLSRPYPRTLKPVRQVCGFTAFYTGMWIPNGRNQILGTHPLLGVDFGQWINRFMWDINLEFQLGGTSSSYNVIYNGAKVSSSRYGGTNIGLNFGYDLVNVKKSVIYLTAGLGGTGFTAVQGDDNNTGLSISAFTKNIGMGIHHFGKKGELIGAALLYNFIDYQNPGGTPIDGNAVTLRLIIGGYD